MPLDVALLRQAALKVGPTQRFFHRLTNGERFFIQADTAWQLFWSLTREQVEWYLDERKAQGFNAVFAVVLSELNGRSSEDEYQRWDGSEGSRAFHPTVYGEVPLVNDDPSRPNEAFFAHVDWCIEQMIRRDMVPFLVPTWGRYVNSGGGSWGPILFNNENAFSFGSYIGKRYPFLPKLLGGDNQPVWVFPGQEYIKRRVNCVSGTLLPGHVRLNSLADLPIMDVHEITEHMVQGIQQTEASLWSEGKPILSYHPSNTWLPGHQEGYASALFPEADWLAFDGCQSGHADGCKAYLVEVMGKWEATSSHIPLAKMWASEPKRPVIDLESHYEACPHGLNSAATWQWNGDDICSGAWQSVISGACGIVYGANAVWQFYDPARAEACGHDPSSSWKDALGHPGAKSLHIIKEFFLSLPAGPYNTRRPAQELLVSNNAPRRQDGDARVDVMRDVTASGGCSWILAHSGSGWPFELDLGVFGTETSLKAEWFDPRTGQRSYAGTVSAGPCVKFAPPTRGCTGDNWVLVLHA